MNVAKQHYRIDETIQAMNERFARANNLLHLRLQLHSSMKKVSLNGNEMRVLFGTHEGRRVFALVADALLSGRDVEENKSILQAIELKIALYDALHDMETRQAYQVRRMTELKTNVAAELLEGAKIAYKGVRTNTKTFAGLCLEVRDAISALGIRSKYLHSLVVRCLLSSKKIVLMFCSTWLRCAII